MQTSKHVMFNQVWTSRCYKEEQEAAARKSFGPSINWSATIISCPLSVCDHICPSEPSQIIPPSMYSFGPCSVWLCWNKYSRAPRPRQWANHLKSFKGSYFLPSPHRIQLTLWPTTQWNMFSPKLKQTKHISSSDDEHGSTRRGESGLRRGKSLQVWAMCQSQE